MAVTLSLAIENLATGAYLSLDQQSDGTAYGCQAQPGATGFGLPGVEAQFVDGAGEGGRFRSSRPLQRDLDIPINVRGSDRANLRHYLGLVMGIVGTGKFRLHVYDDSQVWEHLFVDVVRVGGGTWAMGTEASTEGAGDGELTMILTVRSESPYWQWDSVETASIPGPGSGPLVLDNPGTADAFPTFRLVGPSGGCTLTSPSGEAFSWNGVVLNGQHVDIDTEAGTVTDSSGANRYSGLSTAPKFWRVPAGTTTMNAAISARAPSTRTNYETNPSFISGVTAPWTFTGITGDISSTAMRVVANANTIPNGNPNTTRYAERLFTGLPAGSLVQYRASAVARSVVSPTEVYSWPKIVVTDSTGAVIYTRTLNQYGAILSPMSFFASPVFAVPANGQLTVRIYPGVARATSGAGFYNIGVTIDQIYLGAEGGYFDGNSVASTGETYAWSGSPGNSTSIATEIVSGDATSLNVSWRPREWLVV